MEKVYIIDIGTNSTRLMLAERNGRNPRRIYKTLRTVRTGENVNNTGRLAEAAMVRTIGAIREYTEIMRSENPDAPVYCFATSAVRDSENKYDFVNRVKEETGVSVRILSGEEEADIGFMGAVSGGTGGIIDIGGGSTEVIFGHNGKIEFSYSFQLGCVRSLDMFKNEEEARIYSKKLFDGIDKTAAKGLDFYGIGGTATSIAAIALALPRYDSEKVQNFRITRSEMEALYHKLLSMTAEERLSLPGLDRRRADIIGFGAAILLSFMESFDLAEVIASESDGMEGAIAAGYAE
ncbi:MAG: hypothetical protein IJ973_01305 [Christensenellaceae bacterium]|nr:hypothetical protein [Christensenellaceae bacterium]